MTEEGEDEELEQPAFGRWTRSRRLQIPVAGLALAATAWVVVLAAHHSTGPQADAPTPASTPYVAATPPAGVSAAPSRVSLQCPSGASCLRTTAVPSAVRDAVQAVFPGAVVRTSFSLLGDTDGAGSHLLFRRIELRVGASDIAVVVEPPGVASPTASSVPGPASGDRTRRATLRFPDATVTVTARSTSLPALARLRFLASDARLRNALV